MPELPEVETTRLGVMPHLCGKRVRQFIVREHRLRRPVAGGIAGKLRGQTLLEVGRRGKYLLFGFEQGCLIWHLGMSGSMRIFSAPAEPGPHDHVDLLMHDNTRLRFRDPRRFGSIHYTAGPPRRHKLLRHLGPEPLSADLTAEYLYRRSRGRRQKIKPFIMDSGIVVGVGNIYASEALFESGIDPRRCAGRISLARYGKLTAAIRSVLARAVAKGGTSLRDFVGSGGEPGYFRLELAVYDRADEPCRACGRAIRQIRLGQRSSYYCGYCQR